MHIRIHSVRARFRASARIVGPHLADAADEDAVDGAELTSARFGSRVGTDFDTGESDGDDPERTAR